MSLRRHGCLLSITALAMGVAVPTALADPLSVPMVTPITETAALFDDNAGVREFGVPGIYDPDILGSVDALDGAAGSSTPLPGFPHGLLVVQEGNNTPEVTDGGNIRTDTNFKFVDWSDVQRRSGL